MISVIGVPLESFLFPSGLAVADYAGRVHIIPGGRRTGLRGASAIQTLDAGHSGRRRGRARRGGDQSAARWRWATSTPTSGTTSPSASPSRTSCEQCPRADAGAVHVLFGSLTRAASW